MEEYLVIDLETQKCAQQVTGGWNRIQDFGLSIAVTIGNCDNGSYTLYFKDEKAITWTHYTDDINNRHPILTSQVLIAALYETPLIVTFNGIRFDYEVLRPYGLKPERLYHKSFDILVEMQKVLGHRVSLDTVAQATLGEKKSASGIQAVIWWQLGKIDKIIEYCKKDVEITKRIYEFIKKHGYVSYLNLEGEIETCQVQMRP